ncbi:ABC transporter permease subunit [Desulfosporosinus sp. PR]|uniref:ABC transporter permease subunit n=1 Tax=Candidatus Desulfosporosinus nitrosoreducens TaxID=3401928 RepID=UPI0027E8A213|nr:ABC transporter permease subunit [Desulfosporosinus sp. PR]MDQ7094491.1 ABC transporter permease subunit [Desulfosporosinus sp. PR]
MNDTLYWAMLKHESKKILGCSLGLIFYEWLVTWVYPVLVESPVIEDIPQSFPDPVKRVFGVSTGEEVDMSYEAYISAQLLGRLWTLLISVYGISTSNTLVAHMVKQGFLAYPLSSPLSRFEILNTQIGVLLTELFMVTGATLGGLYTTTSFFGVKIPRWQYFRMAISGFGLGAVVGAYSLLLGVLFDSEEESLRLAGALSGCFYGLDVVSCLSERFSNLKYFTPFGLFRPQEILQGRILPAKGFLVLSSISGTAFLLAGALFRRKSLAL